MVNLSLRNISNIRERADSLTIPVSPFPGTPDHGWMSLKLNLDGLSVPSEIRASGTAGLFGFESLGFPLKRSSGRGPMPESASITLPESVENHGEPAVGRPCVSSQAQWAGTRCRVPPWLSLERGGQGSSLSFTESPRDPGRLFGTEARAPTPGTGFPVTGTAEGSRAAPQLQKGGPCLWQSHRDVLVYQA